MDNFKLYSPNNKFYVYALIDPRDQSIFYVGKGCDKRHQQHFQKISNDKRKQNEDKYNKIDEIEKSGYQVKIEYLFSFLDEKTSYDLERIIIYRLGRKNLKEGSLTNFNQGGVRLKSNLMTSNLFYIDNPENIILLDDLDSNTIKKLDNIKNVSNVIHLNEISPRYQIYTYQFDDFKLNSIDSINCFYNNFYFFKLSLELMHSSLPLIMANRVISKERIIAQYHPRNFIIGFLDLHFYDSDFFKKIDNKIEQNTDFKISLKINKIKVISASLKNNNLKIKSFLIHETTISELIKYQNENGTIQFANKKHLTNLLRTSDKNINIFPHQKQYSKQELKEIEKERDSANRDWNQFIKYYKSI